MMKQTLKWREEYKPEEIRWAHLSSCPEREKGALKRLVEPLMSLVKSYEGGRESHAHKIIQSLFEEYLSAEELFSDNIQQGAGKPKGPLESSSNLDRNGNKGCM